MELVFEWEPRKDQANLKKHGITFTEATSVFGDRLARIFADESHSAEEQREIIIGHSRAERLLLVCFTEREEIASQNHQRPACNQEGTARL